MPTRNVTVYEGSATNLLLVSFPGPLTYAWTVTGGDLTFPADFTLTLGFGSDQGPAPMNGVIAAPPAGVLLRLLATQDHHAESAETVTYLITGDSGQLHLSDTINVTVIDRSTYGEYLSAALTDANTLLTDDNNPVPYRDTPDSVLQVAWASFAPRFLGPVNDPNHDNGEALRAQQYLLGLMTTTDLGGLDFPQGAAPDYASFKWLANNFDVNWLVGAKVPASAPLGAIEAFNGLLDGLEVQWRHYVDGAPPVAAAGPLQFYMRSHDPALDIAGTYAGHAYHLVISDAPPLQPGVVMFDKIGGDYTLSNKSDVLFATAPATVSLGFGDDIAFITAAGSDVSGDAGNDKLVLGDAGGTLRGGAGDDLLIGGSGANHLFGGDGSDVIDGGAGADEVNGNRGGDTIDGGAGGSDTLFGGQGDDLITVHAGAANVNGNIGQDTIIGGAGDETLHGGQGDDVIVGGAGADWISGDRGDDVLTGGAGADTFHISAGGGADRVQDFNPAEHDRVLLDLGSTYTVEQIGPNVVITVDSAQMVLADTVLSTLPDGWLVLG